MSKPKAAKNILDKDINKLTKKMSQSLLYQRNIVKQQEDIIKIAEKKKDEMIARRESAMKKLQSYIDGKKIDENYKSLKWEYESCLEGIDSLNKAINICEESIDEVKLGMSRV